VSRHPVDALLLAVGWVAALAAWAVIRKATAAPADRRLTQAGDALDRAAGRWLSGYRRRYRQWVLDSRRYIDVKGLATAGDHTPQLDEVYVDVALARRAPHQVSGDPLSDVPEDVTERYSILKFLDRQDPLVLVVVGPPGCGKSTLLTYVARSSARSRHRHRGRRGVPILLALRDHAATVAANPEITLPDVLRSTVHAVPVSEPDGWWDLQLRRGKCVVLLDGMDEVGREQERRAIATWVERQIGSYPGNHFVITSRPSGYRSAVIGPANLLAIRPFTSEQVRQFVHRWYLAAECWAPANGSAAGDLRGARLRADESAHDLLKQLQIAAALHDLTVNPLLLTMIANVHRYRGALPGSRTDLYKEICEVMLSRRLQAKNLPEQMPWPDKQALLTRLAYEMMRRRVSDLPQDQILQVLRPGLPSTVTGRDVLDDIAFNGLLVERENGQYAFVHLTFQEYLAARHIRDNALTQTLIDAVGDQWWREVTLLFAVTDNTDPIVRACLNQATIPALTLAFECCDTGHKLAPELRQRLELIQAEAFQPGCDPAHRRLIAAVLATRLARQSVTASSGTRICADPVPVSLYWLFLQDCQVPSPDGACDPKLNPTQPATGIWGSEAMALLAWLNTITVDPTQAQFRLPQFRLPTLEELHEHCDEDTLNFQPGELVTGLWTRPLHGTATPRLWVMPGQPNPHTVSGLTLQEAVTADAADTALFQQLTAAARQCVAAGLKHALTRAGNRARTRDLPQARAIDRALGRVGHLGLDRELVRALARDLDLARALDLDFDLARTLERVLLGDVELDLALARDLARDSSLSRGLTLDLDPVVDDSLAMDLALELARSLKRDLNLHFARDLGYPKFIDVALRWLLGEPLAAALLQAIAADRRSSGQECFAAALLSEAAISQSTLLEVPLDGSLSEKMRDACAAHIAGTYSRRDPGRVAKRLADTAGPLLDKRCLPDRSVIAGIRIAALALAGDAEGDVLGTFRAVSAAVTLLEQRANGQAAVGESVVLAVV
jgi:hypothetical protein